MAAAERRILTLAIVLASAMVAQAFGRFTWGVVLPDARDDVREALSRGDFDGSVSIGFIVDEDEYQHYEKGSIRTVTRGHLVELSIVTRGAYASAQIGGNDG